MQRNKTLSTKSISYALFDIVCTIVGDQRREITCFCLWMVKHGKFKLQQ